MRICSGPVLGYALVAVAAILWGCWVLFLRPAGLDGGMAALISLVVMSLPAPFVLRRASLADRGATWALVIIGIADAINAALFFAALQRGPVSVAVLTHYLAPLLVALVAPWVLREPRSKRALIAAPIVLLGLGMVVRPLDGGFSASALVTAGLGASSALFFATIILASKRAGRSYSPLAVTAGHAPISVLVLLLFFQGSAVPTSLSPAVLTVGAGGALCGFLGTVVFNLGLRRVPAQAASVLIYLEPLTAAVLGFAVFREPIGPLGLAGGAVVLAAGAWVALERAQPPARQQLAAADVRQPTPD
jgi:drug/metabolite transporter (DMT)-like permease